MSRITTPPPITLTNVSVTITPIAFRTDKGVLNGGGELTFHQVQVLASCPTYPFTVLLINLINRAVPEGPISH
jgi:hypothetical protein